LAHLKLPVRHRINVRTTNLLERSFLEERRRTKVIPCLLDEKSAMKLVFATLIQVSER
jgi:putative transposase